MKAKLWLTAQGVMALVLGVSAAVQLNDPDPVRWMAIYAAGAIACVLSIARRLPWFVSAAIGGVALAWAVTLAPAVIARVPAASDVLTWKMRDTSVEETREMFGLLIEVGCMTVLTVRGLFFGRKRRFRHPPDPRVAAHPWLGAMLEALGERYRLGQDAADGIQLLCRTGKARFNPMRVWVRPADHHVLGDYDVRIEEGKPVEVGRALLDQRVSPRLGPLGLTPAQETVEEWAGMVLTRRYAGSCPDPGRAAQAVELMCRGSDQVMNTALE
ncbi:MAG: transmembrane 220 family protein [Myxococcota bacterium]